MELREAQRLYLVAKQAKQERRGHIPGSFDIEFSLPSGWLSCLVGSLESHGKVVTLSADDPRDLVAIRRPSRNSPNSKPLSSIEKRRAENEAKDMLRQGVKLNAASAPIPELHNARVKLTPRRLSSAKRRDNRGCGMISDRESGRLFQ